MIRRHSRPTQLPLTSQILILALPFVFPLFAVVFAMAWWTSYKTKSSARVWGILASLINLQAALFPLLIPPHSIWNGSWLILGIGIAGLIVFARPAEPAQIALEVRQSSAIPRDGTSNWLNKAAPLLLLVGGGAGFLWWQRWVVARDIFIPHTNTYLLLVSVVIGQLIVTMHELGHAAVGLVLGMRLRAFIAGPFQWRIRDGKWEFQFDVRRILAESGATGVVPAAANFPRWADFCVLIGGVAVNAIAGAAALCLAFFHDPDSPIQVGGFLALFGAWNLTAAAVNLIPFRAGSGYSDGAQIYQLLSNGPWADLHRAFKVAGSSLVTSLRPRDYDIDCILRAGRTINQGLQGLLLRLLAYNHYLDTNKLPEAAAALSDAGRIYNETASDAAAELLTPFVFGSAYLARNPDTTRQWWAHVEAKKPSRLNSDYWMAHSAVRWMEGNAKEAIESWEKANALAQQLPQTGAYEFDRYCCSLLRRALDEVPALHAVQ